MIDSETLHAMPTEVENNLEVGLRLRLSGQFAAARRRFQFALALAEVLNSTSGVLGARQLLGSLAQAEGDLVTAWHHHIAVLERSRKVGLQIGVASALHNLGLVAAQQNNLFTARSLFDAAIEIYQALGKDQSAETVRNNMALLIGARMA